MSLRGTGRVPLPPPDAERYTTVCKFCNVGCGYDVYVWPAEKEGTPQSHGIEYKYIDKEYGRTVVVKPDFSQPAAAVSAREGRPWISEGMVSKVVRRDWRAGRGTGEWREYYVAIVPSPECPINEGNYSHRGGTQGDKAWSPWNVAGHRRLKAPLVRIGGRLEPVTWDYAVDLVARVVKGVIDRYGIDRGQGKEGHDVFFHSVDHGGGSGGGYIFTTTYRLFFALGVRTAFLRAQNRPFFGPLYPAFISAGAPDPLTYSIMDIRLADVLVYWGTNPYVVGTVFFIEHALANLRGETVEEKRRWFDQGEPAGPAYMIVVDVRRTETVKAGEAAAPGRVLHLQPKPGTDLVLINAIARIIYERYRDTVEKNIQAYRDAAKNLGLAWDEEAYRLYLEEGLGVGKRSLDEVLTEAERITGVSRADMERAAQWLGEPKQGGFPKRIAVIQENGITFIFNYLAIYALADLCILTGAFRGRPGNACGRHGGHQRGEAGPAPPPPPWASGRPTPDPWWFRDQQKITDYRELMQKWYDFTYGTYYRERYAPSDRFQPVPDFRIVAGHGKVLWVAATENYVFAPQAQRLKAAVSDRAWRVTRYVFAEAFKDIGGKPMGTQYPDYDVKALGIPVTTPPSSEEYAAKVLEALEKTGGLFVVVQDIFPTLMAEDAHVVLPAAEINGEVPDAHISDHERRLRASSAYMDPPGEARPDWWIWAQVARRIVQLYEAEGRGDDKVAQRFRVAFGPIWEAMDRGLDVENEIFKTYVANADEFYSNAGKQLGFNVAWSVAWWTPAMKKLDLNKLRRFRTVGVILPLTEFEERPDGTLVARGVVNLLEPGANPQYREEVITVQPDGTIVREVVRQPSEKARNARAPYMRAVRPWPALWPDYPPFIKETLDRKYWVVNARLNEYWNWGYHDANSPITAARYPYVVVQVNPEDAKAEGLSNGDVVMVYNQNGSVAAVVWITDTVPRGVLMVPYHAILSMAANNITSPSISPVTPVADYKIIKADIRKIGSLTDDQKQQVTFKEIKFS